MAFWTTEFLDKMRKEWMRRIVKIQYRGNNGVWYDASITEKKVVGNKVQITCTTTDSVQMTITAVRILDTVGDIAGQQSESITKSATQGIITVWEFPIYEVTS